MCASRSHESVHPYDELTSDELTHRAGAIDSAQSTVVNVLDASHASVHVVVVTHETTLGALGSASRVTSSVHA